MDEALLATRFESWLNTALSSPPDEIVAYNINLYDSPFKADLVGSTYYDADDPNWACEEHWVATPRMFDFPAGMENIHWEERLELGKRLLRDCIAKGGPAAQVFRRTMATTIGFVDGELIVVCGETA
jgi:hypothetical protein